MRNFLRSVIAGVAGALMLTGALAPALALTVPPTYAPRAFNTQQTHYIRFTFAFNGCVLVSNTCSVKVGSLPYNAFVVRAYQQVTTAFNSGTTDTVALGVSSGGAQLVAAQSVHASTAGTALTVVAANLGLAVTGNNVTPTGADGGFDVYVTYAQTGAAPTAGQATYIIEYFAANDGSCSPVPLATAQPPC
jgi:hypothetical protein